MIELPETITRDQVSAALTALGLDELKNTITSIQISSHHVQLEFVEVKGKRIYRISTEVIVT